MGTMRRYCCVQMKSECYERSCWAFLFQAQRNIQTCNKLVCNRVGNQIDALDLGVIKSNSFSINGPRPIKMLWDSMILKVIF